MTPITTPAPPWDPRAPPARTMTDALDVVMGSDLGPLPFTTLSPTCTPPPRLAARFYRPTTSKAVGSRRRSSAASSRRNSMTSSTHSHHSHPSSSSPAAAASTSCDAAHRAQDLRRASILETRRARLADRAAHAEKVRLRAALARAAPRFSMAEERALAAEKARQRYLAQVAAAGAEEVRRAKRVAEEIKERRRADERKLRDVREERLAEAERRRLLQYHQRGTSGGGHASASAGLHKRGRITNVVVVRPSDVEPTKAVGGAPAPVTEAAVAAAATRIQRAWRTTRRRRVLCEFADQGVSMDGLRRASFEDVSALLAQDRVVLATTRVLRLCGLPPPADDDDDEADGAMADGAMADGERATVRTFLSAYLIQTHPQQVLRLDGEPDEPDLVTQSQQVTHAFEQLLARTGPTNHYTPAPAPARLLATRYRVFRRAFGAWKARDEAVLLHAMVAQYVALDAIWQTVRDAGTLPIVQAEYRQGIRDTQLLLLVRLKRLAGPERAKTLIRDAVRAARRRQRDRDGDRDPAVAAAVAVAAVAPAATLSSPSPSPSSVAVDVDDGVRPGAGPGAVSPSFAAVDLLPHEAGGHPPPPPPPPPPTPSPSPSPPSTPLHHFAALPSILPANRTLTHELALNGSYRIDADAVLAGEPRASRRRALFARMRADLRHADHRPALEPSWILALAAHLRARLLRLLTPGTSLHVLVSDALEPDVIGRQCARRAFSYPTFFAFMAALLPRLCAPVRDRDVQRWVAKADADAEVDVIEHVEGLMHLIDLLSLDYANHLLLDAAPRLIREAPAYEARCFAQDLAAAGDGGLRHLERWWRQARARLVVDEAPHLGPAAGAVVSSSRPAAARIYLRALTDTFIVGGDLDLDLDHDDGGSAALPETLRVLDRARIHRIRGDARRIVSVAASLLTAKNLLKRDVATPWKWEAGRMWELLLRQEEEEEEAATKEEDDDSSSGGGRLARVTQHMLAILESLHALPAHTKIQLERWVGRILAQTQPWTTQSGTGTGTGPRAAGPVDPVVRCLFHGLRAHLFQRLLRAGSGSGSGGSGGGGSGRALLVSSGLGEFVPRIALMVAEVCAVARVDRASHAVWYDHVAARVEAEVDADAHADADAAAKEGRDGMA
ncbi:MAG: hypothetical protein M1826_000875 [Phylliscum demangeonii]|nr:MAG: hypothetical protein M1826_000875 [Phylliscum demangeonii]